jgi:hypothetical protein
MSALEGESRWPSAEVVLAGIQALLELAQPAARIEAETGSPRWWEMSAGLFTRVVTLTETIVHMSQLGRPSDLNLLARCLFEHVVVLAWIATPDDTSRVERLERDSYRSAAIVNDEMDRLGIGFLTDAGREWVREQAGRRNEVPPVPELARKVDEEWHDRLGLVELNRLVASYTLVYRSGSSFVHPSVLGMFGNRKRVADGHRYTIEPRSDTRGVLAPVFTLLAVALVVAAHTIGRPPPLAIKAIVNDFADVVEAG